jgi:hypothetical protein
MHILVAVSPNQTRRRVYGSFLEGGGAEYDPLYFIHPAFRNPGAIY